MELQEHYNPLSYQIPEILPRQLNWMGRKIEKIRALEAKGTIYKIIVKIMIVLSSLIMIYSLIGLPIFLLAFKEYIIQENHEGNLQYIELLKQSSTEQINHAFINGRTAPLDHEKFDLSKDAREDMIRDLDILSPNSITDKELIRVAAITYDNYRPRYNLT